MSYVRKEDWIEHIADTIKEHLRDNPELLGLSLSYLHENLPLSAEKHEWEQALHRLNLQGIVGQAIHGKTYCCGSCRADRWMVVR